jgi:hypothetical protein
MSPVWRDLKSIDSVNSFLKVVVLNLHLLRGGNQNYASDWDRRT